MKPFSIGFRLTAWYFAALAATLGVFGFAAFFAMEKGIQTSVDQGLRGEARGIEELMTRVISRAPGDTEELQYELREHSQIRAEAEFSQVSDEQGRWVYRSPLMMRNDVPQAAAGAAPIYALQAKSVALRALVQEARIGGRTYRIQVASPMNAFYQALNQFKWLILGLSLLLLVLASAGGYWMSRRALSPVDGIVSAAQNINSKNLSKRLKVPDSGDELQRLSETLNNMLERLEAAFTRITRFTADAAHELRTPLALMRTVTEVSLRTSSTAAEYREAQVQILEELERVSGMAEKLMLLTRADAGVETLRRDHLDLCQSLQAACKQGRILAEAKQISFEESIAKKPVAVEGDRDALDRLFLILIDNAVKYTSPNGQIRVCLSTTDGICITEVKDTGIGIGKEDLPHIFDRFYRADKARSRESGGVGLGLSIARWEAEAHGGSIEVESATGQGSTFRVRLPIIKG